MRIAAPNNTTKRRRPCTAVAALALLVCFAAAFLLYASFAQHEHAIGSCCAACILINTARSHRQSGYLLYMLQPAMLALFASALFLLCSQTLIDTKTRMNN